MTAGIRFDGVSKYYGPVLGIADISFELSEGVHGLLGANGAGKSTILKLSAGLIDANRGRVEVLGGAPRSSLRTRARIGICPDVDQFYERMSGFAWVQFMARFFGYSKREARKRAEERMDEVGMTHAMHRPLASYSKGMRQRTKLARALIADPEVLLLDEPMTGLDPIARNEMVTILRNLGSTGRCVLVSSHILKEVEAMTERMLLIHQGRLLAEGSVDEIRQQLDQWPHRIELRAEDPRGLAALLLQEGHAQSIEIDGDRLILETGMAEAFYSRLTELGSQPEYRVQSLRALDEGFEAVFDYLVKR